MLFQFVSFCFMFSFCEDDDYVLLRLSFDPVVAADDDDVVVL